MTLTNIKNYLEHQITYSWYLNAAIDYGTSGKFIDCEVNGHNLKIIWEEMGQRLEAVIAWFTEYTLEQLYDIWMESDWEEVK